MAEKTSFHMQGEGAVRRAINRGGENYGIVGRESDPQVARTMAYLVKPGIDSALKGLKDDPNGGIGIVKTSDGRVGLTVAPGTVDAAGHSTSYHSMARGIDQGWRKAGKVQQDYYDKVARAQAELRRVRNNI